MASRNRQRDAVVRIIERIVVTPAPRRTPPPLVITFTRRSAEDDEVLAPVDAAQDRGHA